ncbi:MAG: hypothetical protein HOM68_22465 [Gemmatimonadetes bacterium]|jgi:D-threo-aldose 1-dehydrogenase|nr:hypothetical protein [Gemmatimonadota bacterium]MBT4613413.1 hypothetical protein [Gemmatimonadota bacterium]MBT5059324.1 hypothetical protein [Gemmatimonadota bacterium]MBT5145574.1 hypothetical protein [Gemmatimonadota bacterium]MBT5591762.1 hypothetical protein [Gemmatimonadota bacterium]
MQTKRLGRTDLEVPIVGMGTAFLGIAGVNQAAMAYSDLTKPWDVPLAEDEGAAAVIAAIEGGCGLIDTAPLYCAGASERMIGEALRRRPDLVDRATVTTKVGQQYGVIDHSYDAVMRHVDESQKRLGLEHFDVLFIHDAMDVPMERVMAADGTLGALRQLQKEGIARWIGSAANDPGTNADYIETGEFDAAVIPECWSLLNQRARNRILPAAEKHNVGLVGATALERGLLATGPVSGTNYLARNFTQDVLDHVAVIQALCGDHGVPLGAVALAWCTRHPQVASTIPGARVASEARANAAAAAVEIPAQLWDDLEPMVRHWPVSQI